MKLTVLLGSVFLLGVSPAFAQDDLGKTMFAVCMACHGPDGQGLPVGPQKMAPPLAGSKLANGDPGVFSLIVLKGIQKETQQYVGIMAPLELALDDAKLAAVMTYVRSNFGNKASAVTAEEVKGFREKWKDIKAPVSRAKLEELEKAAAPAAGGAAPAPAAPTGR